MHYFYHGVPDPMIGHELVPLNKMEDAMNEVKGVHLKKYEGREEVLERKIPLLDCLWNDVVQFLPFHPRKIFELQVEMGFIPEVPPFKFFEIPVDMFEPDLTVVFFKTAAGEENTSVKWLRDVHLEKIQNIPQETIDYYKTVVGTGELPWNYQFVPHVVYKGTVDITGLKIITL